MKRALSERIAGWRVAFKVGHYAFRKILENQSKGGAKFYTLTLSFFGNEKDQKTYQRANTLMDRAVRENGACQFYFKDRERHTVKFEGKADENK